jgi:membrane-associated protease RseP (regulator of RpoE activity)
MSLAPYLLAWRTTPLHDREVIDALVDRVHQAPSSELSSALTEWPGTYYWSDEPDGRHLVLTRPTSRPREAWAMHAVLLLGVLITMTASGGVLAGALPGDMMGWTPALLLHALPRGLSFSLPLLAILFTHEMGHYITARRYQLSVSPPFFIPGIPAPWGIGTFGAFIRLRTIVNDRRQLLDVGAAGPIAGFLVALPILWYGLAHSQPWLHPVENLTKVPFGMVMPWGEDVAPVGDSILTWLLHHLTTTSPTLLLHPTAVAGWFGMFVTMLNLLPMAQLDGGHIVYAASPRFHQPVARGIWLVIMLLGWFWWGWLFWGFIVLVLSRGQLRHPPVLDAYRPLPTSRRWLLVASAVLFILTFAPVPFPR